MAAMVQYSVGTSTSNPPPTKDSDMAPKTADERLASSSLLSLSSGDTPTSGAGASSNLRAFSDLSSSKSAEMKLPSIRDKLQQDGSRPQGNGEASPEKQEEIPKTSAPKSQILFPVSTGNIGDNPFFVKGVFNATVCLSREGGYFITLPPDQEKRAIDAVPTLAEHARMYSQSMLPPTNQKKRGGVKRGLAEKKATADTGGEGSPNNGRRKTCSREGCGRAVRRQGLCGRHGGRETCSVENCKKFARGKNKLCHRHLPDSTKPQCVTPNCKRAPQVAGKLCYSCATNSTSGSMRVPVTPVNIKARGTSSKSQPGPSPQAYNEQFQSGMPNRSMKCGFMVPPGSYHSGQPVPYGVPVQYGPAYHQGPLPMQGHQTNPQYIYQAY